MSLRLSVKLSLIGMCIVFAVRLLGTIVPSIFNPYPIAVTGGVIHLVANLILAYFFYVLTRDYIDHRRESLRNAARWASMGAVIHALMNLRFIINITNPYVLPEFIRDEFVNLIAPLIGVVFILMFFIQYRNALFPDERSNLLRAINSAIGGHAVIAFLQIVVLCNHFFSDASFNHADGLGTIGWVVFPVLVISLLAILSFYWSFLRFLTKQSGESETPFDRYL